MTEKHISLPATSPQTGDVYQHYKGNLYEVVSLALHANMHEWMVIYKPLYEHPLAPLFTRSLVEWNELVPQGTTRVQRFTYKGIQK